MMLWQRPNLNEWRTRNRRIVIERALYRDGFEISHRVSLRHYRWVLDDSNDVRAFKTLVEAKMFAWREIIAKPAGQVA